MAKWKYILHLVRLEDRQAIDETVGGGLNGMGQHGWEAVAWIPSPESDDTGYVLLKMQVD